MKLRKNYLVGTICLSLVVSGLAAAAASPPFLSIDYESANGPFPAEGDTQAGFRPFTQHNAAGRIYSTSEGNIFVNVAGEQPAGEDGYFDRGPIPDNPPFTFGELYRDFAFNNNEKQMTFSFAGLKPSTAYSVTWFSYDNGGNHHVTFAGVGGSTGSAGPLDYIGGVPPTNNYDPRNAATGLFTTDGAGGLTVLAVDTGELRVNGVQIAVAAPPQIRITQFSVNPADGSGLMTFTSEPEAIYSIFGASNLDTPQTTIWTEVELNFTSGGQTTTKGFIDFDAPGAPTRFYRVVKVP